MPSVEHIKLINKDNMGPQKERICFVISMDQEKLNLINILLVCVVPGPVWGPLQPCEAPRAVWGQSK